MKAIQNQSSADKARTVRCGSVVVTGHAIDQYLDRHKDRPSGNGREFHKVIGLQIVEDLKTAKFWREKENGTLFYNDGMVYVVKVFQHYRKVLTCYPRIVKEVAC